jgi:hypothetical protein
MTPATAAASAAVRLPLPAAAPYEECLHGFRIRVRSIAIAGRDGWWEWSAMRRGFVRTGADLPAGMHLLYDSADVRVPFSAALRMAREATERMARKAGWA